MTLGRILLWFYCLKIEAAILLMVVSSAIFCFGWSRLENRIFWRRMVFGLLVMLAAAIIYTTVGNRSVSEDVVLKLTPFHSYREVWAGGNPEIYRSNFMNAALFYPAGLLLTSLLPNKWHGWGKCVLVVVLLMAMSVGIEYAQYRYGLGDCEVDDVIHNTAGALAGSVAALLLPPLLNWIWEKGKIILEKVNT